MKQQKLAHEENPCPERKGGQKTQSSSGRPSDDELPEGGIANSFEKDGLFNKKQEKA